MQAHALTIYGALARSPSTWREIPLLLGFNLVLVVTSYVSFQLPWSPVPFTGQTFGILLIAIALGRLRGAGVVLAYLGEGAMGLPIFAGGNAGMGVLLGPTGGYLIGFLVAAFVVGWLADIGFSRKYHLSLLAMLAGMIVIYVCGLAWLALFVPADRLLAAGLYPFLPGAAIKLGLASVMLPTVWRFVGTRPS
ncbi:MAG: biotin transporter BioY [candidate division Zixibacteria bacterium]|nr:biotin transporter BioY [candidate division Zixibacteria bacterium]